MILFKLVFLPFRLVLGVMALTVKVGWGSARLLGMRRLFWLTVGFVAGLLLAPMPGSEMRARIRDSLEAEVAEDLDLGGGTVATAAASGPVA